MKFKSLLLIAIMITSMAVMTACGGGATDDSPITDESENVEQEEGEALPKEGTYTATVETADGSGKFDVEMTVVGSNIEDFQVSSQEGIEIDETTIENFRTELIENQSPKNINLDEIDGAEEEISLLMQAIADVYILSLVGQN